MIISGLTVTNYSYTLHIWNDENILQYTVNCNPNTKNNKYKGYKNTLKYEFD